MNYMFFDDQSFFVRERNDQTITKFEIIKKGYDYFFVVNNIKYSNKNVCLYYGKNESIILDLFQGYLRIHLFEGTPYLNHRVKDNLFYLCFYVRYSES